MNDLDRAVEAMKQAALKEVGDVVRDQLMNDIVAFMAGIEWDEDEEGLWPEKMDRVVDQLAGRLGGHDSLAYVLLYIMQRLMNRGHIRATASRYGPKGQEMLTEERITMSAPDKACAGRAFSLYSPTLAAIDLTVDIEAP